LKDFLDLNELNEKLKESGIQENFDKLMKTFLKRASIKVFNNSHDFIIDEYISPFINNNLLKIIDIFKNLKDSN